MKAVNKENIINFAPSIVKDMDEKTKSINIDKQTWTEWIKFAVNKTGSTRKISEELEKALQEYMKRHK
jgi:hypothetical protein